MVPGELVPDGQTILGAYEAAALESAREARDLGLIAARRNYPAGPRGDAQAIKGYVSRTKEGLAITIAPPRKRAFIYRFVEGGTGVEGPRGRPIARNRRGRLPSGEVPTGRGQRPQRPFERTREQEGPRVVQIMEAGPEAARRRLGL